MIYTLVFCKILKWEDLAKLPEQSGLFLHYDFFSTENHSIPSLKISEKIDEFNEEIKSKDPVIGIINMVEIPGFGILKFDVEKAVDELFHNKKINHDSFKGSTFRYLLSDLLKLKEKESEYSKESETCVFSVIVGWIKHPLLNEYEYCGILDVV